MGLNKGMVWRVFSAALCITLFSFSGLWAEPSDSDTISDILKMVEVNRNLLEKEMSQSQVRIDLETQRVLEAMDHLFETKISRLIVQHHKEVAAAVQKVELTDSAWNISLSQLKAVVGQDDSIKAICEDFIQESKKRIEPLLEGLAEKMQAEIEPVVNEAITEAQENIRRPFQESIIHYFDVFQGVDLPAAPLPVSLMPKEIQAGKTNIPILGISGILILLLRKLIRKIVQRITVRITGKVLARAIPIIGTLLLLVDVYDVAMAKVNLEKEIRKQFIETYQEEVTAQTFWRESSEGEESFRSRMKDSVDELLEKWSQQCKEEVQRVMDAAQVAMLSPNARDYMIAEKDKGRDEEQIAQSMILVGRSFEPGLIREQPLEKLLDILSWAPDRTELRRLVYALGNHTFMEEYDKGGHHFLEAAHVIGIEEVSRMAKGESALNWRDAQEAFMTLSSDASQPVRRGLLLLLEAGFPYKGVSTASLEAAGRHEELFLFLRPTLAYDPPRLLKLLVDDETRDVLRRCHGADAEFAGACAKEWSELTWKRYADPERLEALLAVAAYRKKETGQSQDAFIRSVTKQDELSTIYQESGTDGLRIWDAFVTEESGDIDRKLAREALSFYKKGYPPSGLMTPEGIDMAKATSWLPFMKQSAFKVLRGLGSLGLFVFFALYAIVILFILSVIVSLLFKIRRIIRGEGSGDPVEKRRPVRIVQEFEEEAQPVIKGETPVDSTPQITAPEKKTTPVGALEDQRGGKAATSDTEDKDKPEEEQSS